MTLKFSADINNILGSGNKDQADLCCYAEILACSYNHYSEKDRLCTLRRIDNSLCLYSFENQ